MKDIKKVFGFLYRVVVLMVCMECYGDKFIFEGEMWGIKVEGKWDDVCWYLFFLALKKGVE